MPTTAKSKIKINAQGLNKLIDQEVHKVQILDPAIVIGTFLAEVVKQFHQKFEVQHDIWSKYLETHLFPRFNFFELLMPSYAMAYLHLDL